MKVELKLYATLMRYLPEEADGHSLMLDVPEGTTAAQLIEDRSLPKESCFLVLVDGTYLKPEELAADRRRVGKGRLSRPVGLYCNMPRDN
jgi:hypothetical protein